MSKVIEPKVGMRVRLADGGRLNHHLPSAVITRVQKRPKSARFILDVRFGSRFCFWGWRIRGVEASWFEDSQTGKRLCTREERQ